MASSSSASRIVVLESTAPSGHPFSRSFTGGKVNGTGSKERAWDWPSRKPSSRHMEARSQSQADLAKAPFLPSACLCSTSTPLFEIKSAFREQRAFMQMREAGYQHLTKAMEARCIVIIAFGAFLIAAPLVTSKRLSAQTATGAVIASLQESLVPAEPPPPVVKSE